MTEQDITPDSDSAARNVPDNTVAFQGESGAYSHLACRQIFPDMAALPCPTFEDAFIAVEEKQARYAMIPIENSVAGRVADIHQLLPNAGLHFVGEHFLRVNHHLLAPPGATVKTLKRVMSHVQALGQCHDTLRGLGLKAVSYADTAGAARHVAEMNDPAVGAIASALAGEIYGLQSLMAEVEDAAHNTTRFVIMSREPIRPAAGAAPAMTSFIFQTRNVPAALYKALGGFATNGVNMTKLESYQLEGSFSATQFYADVEGHPDDEPVALALEELDFFTSEVRIMGVYPAHSYRRGEG
ncbi:MAG: prephenate dehydratase [Sphingomonadales bacterium]